MRIMRYNQGMTLVMVISLPGQDEIVGRPIDRSGRPISPDELLAGNDLAVTWFQMGIVTFQDREVLPERDEFTAMLEEMIRETTPELD